MLSDQDIENLHVDYVVLLDSDESGDLYMQHLFPMWTQVIVVTLDGKYPLDARLRNRVLSELEHNENIYCMIFGARASSSMKIATKRRLHMVDFLFTDLVHFPWQKPRLELNEDRLITIMQAFCEQIAQHDSRVQSYNAVLDHYANSQHDHQANSLKWYHALVKS